MKRLLLCLLLASCASSKSTPEAPSAPVQSTPSATSAAPATEFAAGQSQAQDNLGLDGWQAQFSETLADLEHLDCPNACRALGSLSRSASSICGMTGQGSSVCLDVQKRKDDATARVQDRCGSCP